MLVTIDLNIITLVEELPKTKLLYWDQQYQKTCDSEIIKMVQEKNEVYIILDKTIFHPKNGGQPTDIGIIKDSEQEISIKKCFITKDVIIHIGKNSEQKVLQNNTNSEINWETRYLYMKRHTTAHLLDHCISKVVEKDVITNDSWLGDECYIGYIGKNITRNEMEEAFKMANDMTEKNLDIFSELISYEELIKKAPNAPNLHRIPKKNGLRIVTIQDCESIPCGGTHVEKLGEIKKIVFNKIEPTENGYKIFYDVK